MHNKIIQTRKNYVTSEILLVKNTNVELVIESLWGGGIKHM